MPELKWTERKFNFDSPEGMFPVFIERLRGTAARIEDMVKNLPEELLQKKNGTAWSVKEHIGHLIDLEELHDGRIDDFLEGKETLRAADMANKKTYAANHNTSNTPELISALSNVRAHFISRLEKSDPALSALHPRLQKQMRVVDLAYFVAEHDDWHITLMREAIDGK